MRRFIVGFFAIIGLLVVLILIAGGTVAYYFRGQRPTVIADNTVLSLDITDGFADAAPQNRLQSLLLSSKPSLRDVLDAIERATNDPRVTGLVARIGDGEMGVAQAQELRDAIAQFRAKGKRAVAYADSFGEFSSGTRSYYLASAFGDVWLQPHGMLGLIGIRVEETYFKGTLDLLGVTARFSHREEYKSAADPLLVKQMTGPDREQIQALIDSVYNQIVNGIATSRKIDPADVRALINHGPLLAQEALNAHLVDHIGYADEALASLGLSAEGDRKPVALARYLANAGRPHTSGPTIALIYATGLIARGDDNNSSPFGSDNPSSDQVIRALQLAARDPAVRAIVFRVDSPGGSAVASESIWRETLRAKLAGKKLIVSMGDVAGSGGYYIAASADKIVAEPATLTGSIGVVGGKILLSGLMDKVGVSTSSVQDGANAGIGSSTEDFTPATQARFEAFLDDVYGAFKDRVAQGRNMNAAAVEAIAKGRIWSGEDAKGKGLVDALGGLSTAVQLAKEAAGIAPDSDVTLKLYPPQSNPFRQLIARATGEDPSVDTALLGHWFAEAQPILTEIERLEMPPDALVMAPVELQ